MLAGRAAEALLQIFQQLLLLVAEANRGFHHHAAQQIALRAAAHRLNAPAAHAEQLAGLGFAGHLQIDAAVKRRDFNLAAERRHGEVNRHFTVEVIAFALENRVLLNLHLDVQIARRSAVLAALDKKDYSKEALSAYITEYESMFVGKDMKTYAGAPEFLENDEMYGEVGELVANVLYGVYNHDLTPRKHLVKVAWDAFKESPLKLNKLAKIAVQGMRTM